MADGAEDPVLIEVPKGSYHGGMALPCRANRFPPKPLPEPPPRRWVVRGLVAEWFASGFVAAAALAAAPPLSSGCSARTPKIPPLVEDFWQPFLRSPQAPLIVFSNHRFVGSSATGLRSFRDGVESPADSNDTYSGTGTVMAVAELSNLFSLGRPSAAIEAGRTAHLG